MSARETALLTLSAMERQNAWSNQYLKKAIRKANLDQRDAALATRICFGVLQNRMLLDFYLGHFSNVKLEKMESKVRNNLRIGLYQMLFLTRVPQNAAVNEAVELTKKHCKNPRAPGMVNGILRNLARNLDQLPLLEQGDPLQYLSVRYSHPLWLVQEFASLLPEKEVEQLLACDNSEPPTMVQVNTCLCTTAAAVMTLEAEGAAVTRHPWLEGCLMLSDMGDLEKLRAFQDGLIYVQDPAARMAVMAAGLKPGCYVLDACAAPGGKSFAAALDMEGRGEVVSCDIHAHKKKLIEVGAERLRLDCITVVTEDASKPKTEWREAFDAVLADVPCSGLGVIRKKPEIRYKNPTEMVELPHIQSKILNNVAQYVKPGGILLYSTCTLRREENQDRVEEFLARHPEFHRESFSLPLPVGKIEDGMLTLWPHQTNTDGFFIARFRKGI